MALILDLPDPGATERLGGDLALIVRKGDVIALSGELGAGKTTLARALIRALAQDQELEVPSPTYTLVQSYQGRVQVSHFDLYRLASPSELDELGLAEALETGIVLVEWPERAGNLPPARHIRIEIIESGEGRSARITGAPEALARIERTLLIRAFLQSCQLGDARRAWFQGDASTRAFERVTRPDGTDLILMDHPEKPDLSPVIDGRSYRQTARITWTVTPFVAVAHALREHGYAAPMIRANDLENGIVLMENLGQGHIVDADGTPVEERYCAAAELLASLHDANISRDLAFGGGKSYRLPPYDRDALMIEARLMLDWYLPYRLKRKATNAEEARFTALWDELIEFLGSAETGLILRDYHSPNIIWREGESGVAKLGLVDIQDALYGPLSYDVSSLAQDVRVTMPEALEARVLGAYIAARKSSGDFDEAAFRRAYVITAMQRASKVLGIFVRLDQRDGKPDYLKHLPRIEDYVRRTIAHPALANLAEFYSSFGLA